MIENTIYYSKGEKRIAHSIIKSINSKSFAYTHVGCIAPPTKVVTDQIRMMK
jgi:hypothetical protein